MVLAQILVIAPHKLRGNQKYVFKLTATDAAGQSGWGSVEVKVNAAPSNGWVEVLLLLLYCYCCS